MKTKSFERLWVGCVVLAIGALTGGCPHLDAVIFANTSLDSAVRAELGLPLGVLSKADVLDLMVLDARSMGIRDLTGLDECTNLTWLNLDTNDISDLSPLEGLTNLRYLNLESNDCHDLWPLAGLFNLKDLQLSDNEIWDLAPLVANAENGGMGYGSVVTVGEESLLDNDQQMSVVVADQIARMTDRGVNVILTTTQGSRK